MAMLTLSATQGAASTLSTLASKSPEPIGLFTIWIFGKHPENLSVMESSEKGGGCQKGFKGQMNPKDPAVVKILRRSKFTLRSKFTIAY